MSRGQYRCNHWVTFVSNSKKSHVAFETSNTDTLPETNLIRNFCSLRYSSTGCSKDRDSKALFEALDIVIHTKHTCEVTTCCQSGFPFLQGRMYAEVGTKVVFLVASDQLCFSELLRSVTTDLFSLC